MHGTALHCTALHCTALHCTAILYDTIFNCSTPRPNAARAVSQTEEVQSTASIYCAVQCSAVQCSAVQCSAVQCSAVSGTPLMRETSLCTCVRAGGPVYT